MGRSRRTDTGAARPPIQVPASSPPGPARSSQTAPKRLGTACGRRWRPCRRPSAWQAAETAHRAAGGGVDQRRAGAQARFSPPRPWMTSSTARGASGVFVRCGGDRAGGPPPAGSTGPCAWPRVMVATNGAPALTPGDARRGSMTLTTSPTCAARAGDVTPAHASPRAVEGSKGGVGFPINIYTILVRRRRGQRRALSLNLHLGDQRSRALRGRASEIGAPS